MIRQQFDVENYWKVIVYYNVDYNLFSSIAKELRSINTSDGMVWEIYNMMSEGKAKAVTYSNLKKHMSIILFNRHSSLKDYINSIVHEAEHVKQAMLEAYHVEDKGEPPAYTIGYLVMRMYEVYRKWLM
jgi:hypothetical protein